MKRAISIRKRYFHIVLITTLFLVVVSSLVFLYIQSSNSKLHVSSRLRVKMANDSHAMLNKINESNRLLDLYLISPQQKYRDEYFQKLHISQNKLTKMSGNDWVKEYSLTEESKELHKLLAKLSSSAQKLMEIRAVSVDMYPAIRIAETSMVYISTDFTTAINQAIAETRETEPVNIKYYDAFYNLRDKWRRLILAYRVYVINQMGSMSVSVDFSQVNNIELYINEIIRSLNKGFSKKSENFELGIQSLYSIDKMKELSAEWYKEFKKVKTLAQTGQWRADVPIILNDIYPIVDEIYFNLNQFELTLNLSAENYLNKQYKTSQQITIFLWFLVFLFVVIFSFVYYVIDQSLLKPILVLSGQLHETQGKKFNFMHSTVNNIEMNEFVSALNERQSQVKSRQDELEYMALHDSLTDLPNRILLIDRINEAIKRYSRNETPFSLFILDLNKFKEVNDTLGHFAGDELLKAVSTRIANSIRNTDTLARLGGDEFSILANNMDVIAIEELSHKINKALEYEFMIQGQSLYIGSSIGIALYPQHGHDAETLLKHADIAMYESKKNKIDYNIYNPARDVSKINKISLSSELRQALDKQQLYLEYQPVYDLSRDEIIGFECLIRWQHPVYGTLVPDEFIYEAQRSGFIKKISLWVVKKVIQSTELLQQCNKNIYLSINLTCLDLQDKYHIKQITSCFSDSGLEANSIMIEIKESTSLYETPIIHESLHALKNHGFQFGLDDFGVSLTILSHLSVMPIDVLKIDSNLISMLASSYTESMIVKCIIELAHYNQIKIVAEGVENQETFSILKEMGCEYAQGYFINQPISLEKAISMIGSGNQSNSETTSLTLIK